MTTTGGAVCSGVSRIWAHRRGSCQSGAGRVRRPVRLSQMAAGRCGLGQQRWGCERRLLVALQLTQWLCASCADWPAPAQWPTGGHGAPWGRAAARTHPTCAALTNSSPCDLAKPALAAFGMDSARTKTHGQDPQVRATNVVCIPLLIPQPDRERYQLFSVSPHI